MKECERKGEMGKSGQERERKGKEGGESERKGEMGKSGQEM